jgi:hypothetical protein
VSGDLGNKSGEVGRNSSARVDQYGNNGSSSITGIDIKEEIAKISDQEKSKAHRRFDSIKQRFIACIHSMPYTTTGQIPNSDTT